MVSIEEVKMAYRMLLMALLALGCSKAYVKSYNRGVDYLNMGLEEEAIREFQEALKQKHDYPDAHYGLGMSYLELDEPEEALKHLKEALKLDPDDPKYLWACGLAFYKLGRYEEAAECLEKSYRLRPDWECAYNLGVVLRELGRYGEAVSYLKKALKNADLLSSAHILENLALAYEDLLQHEKALKCWRDALRYEKDERRREEIASHIRDLTPTGPSIVLDATPDTVLSESVSIRGRAMDERGVEDVWVLVNRKLARGIVVEPVTEREKRFSFEVSLENGENVITVYAKNTAGITSEEEVRIFRKLVPAAPELWALVVGVGDYQDPSIPDLKYADDDAEALYDFLRGQKGKAFSDVHVRILTNQEATREDVTRALAYFITRSAPQDLVVVFLAGHGITEAGQYYFAVHDTRRDNLFGTAIRMQDFTDAFSRIGAERVLLLNDTCHSSGIVLASRGFGEIAEEFYRKLSSSKGKVTISASRFDEVSLEDPDLGHGVFTYFLLRGLEGECDGNSDGIVSVLELYNYLSRKVPDYTKGAQHPSMILPEGGLVGDMPIAKVGD